MITDWLQRRELNRSFSVAKELQAGAAAEDAAKETILSIKRSSTNRLTSEKT